MSFRSPVHTRNASRNRIPMCRRCGGQAPPLVQCDHCVSHYHLACVGEDVTDETVQWRCQDCDRYNTIDRLEGAVGGSSDARCTPSRTLSPVLEGTFVYNATTNQSTPISHALGTPSTHAPNPAIVTTMYSPANAVNPTSIFTTPIPHTVPFGAAANGFMQPSTAQYDRATAVSTHPSFTGPSPVTTVYHWPPNTPSYVPPLPYVPPPPAFHGATTTQPIYQTTLNQPTPYAVPATTFNNGSNFNMDGLSTALPIIGGHPNSQHSGYIPKPCTSYNANPNFAPSQYCSIPGPCNPPLTAYNSHYSGQGSSFAVPNQQPNVNQAFPPNFALQMQHLLARQVIKQELPVFSGHPDEWPMFLSSFRQSTISGGYTDEENVHRLRKSLKGDALLTVQGLLCDSVHVDRIMVTLQQRFGQPEAIIRHQIEKIRNEIHVKAEKLDSIVNFSIHVANLCATMQATMQNGHLNNPILLQELVDKLPPPLKLQWATHRMLVGQANITSFSIWLETMATAISIVQPYTPPTSKAKGESKASKFVNVHVDEEAADRHDLSSSKVVATNPVNVNPTTTRATNTQKSEPKTDVCPACKTKECKSVAKCRSFKEFSRNGRWNLVKTARLCRVCFAKHHTKDCSNSKKCGIDGCEKYHHELLHPTKTEPPAVVNHQSNYESIMFRIVPVTLRSPTASLDTYAFLDDGSSVTLMDQDLATELNLQGDLKPFNVRWTNGTHRRESNSQVVKLQISPRGNHEKVFDFEARTVNELDLPLQTVEMDKLKKSFPHLDGLPIQSFKSVKPKVLIGIDQWRLAAPIKVTEGNSHDPIGTKTRLGWCVCGTIPKSVVNTALIHHHIGEEEDDKLESLIRNYFSIDSLGVTRDHEQTLNKDEQKAEKIMQETLKMRDDRYEVGLLWRYQLERLPDSRAMAEQRLKCLERKLKSSPQLLLGVRQELAMYQEKNYIRKITPEELQAENPKRWYLPVFPVQNPNKPKKLRLVWDAAATVKGVSLNSALLKGPDLYSSLLGILLRFRQHHTAVTADIEQMFHRVYIRPEDCQSQLFLWRDCDQHREPEVYSMDVMLFGASSSPYQAQYVLKHNANKYQGVYARAVTSILQNHYMDDLLDSFETEAEAIQVAAQVRQIHQSGGFKIRNWLSNSSRLEEEMNQSHEQPETYQFTTPDSATEKVLGVFWNKQKDVITYSLQFNKTTADVLNGMRMPTKRESLRTLMSCYDPQGLVSHYMIGLKTLQQNLWRYDTKWDDFIPTETHTQWKTWLKVLPKIEELEIPRAYLLKGWVWSECVVDLVTFVDASDRACCCATYLRVEMSGEVYVTLVSSKTKTAPIKPVTVPRLELQSGVMGVRLTKTILESLTLNIRSIRYFTDSTTVLHWLDSRRRLQSFMACRVGEILESSQRAQWYWLPSEHNAADKGTKWNPNFVLDDDIWFHGPKFLLDHPTTWPVEPRKEVTDEDELGVYFHHEMSYDGTIDVQRFSKWSRLLRATAFTLRFLENCRQPAADRKLGPLQQEELQKAESTLFREAQQSQYPLEYSLLVADKPIARTSALHKLSPYLDNQKVIRMRGRIGASSAAFDTKFPIVLPWQHRVTYLLVNEVHRTCAHQFAETVVHMLRQRFQISKLRPLVRKVTHECNYCHIRKARPQVPEMSPLPAARLADHCAPFTYTGVDLYGPMDVAIGRRKEKRWGVIFTCLTIRAVHLEVATDLSTDSFLICLRNFSNRRGQPHEMYCDRGTNFIGAKNVLRNLDESFDYADIAAKSTSPKMKWIFNPPLSAHMGGSWERLIRSVKSALSVLQTTRTPTPEVLNSTLVEIEYMINSRPLTYIPISGPEEAPLTPNDFLMYSSDGTRVMGTPSDEIEVVRHSWQFVQNTVQRAWRKWIREYLPTLTRRGKWFDEVPELTEGDIVVVIDDNNRKRNWPLGRVLATKVSKDGHIRSATIQMQGGVFDRPVSKMAKLDIADKESEHNGSRAPLLSQNPNRHFSATCVLASPAP